MTIIFDKNDCIELVPYNAEWLHMAKLEIENLRNILPRNHVLDIQHVGSTAIFGLSAKPIIDIQIAVDSLMGIKQTAIDLLKTLGYEFWYDNPDIERMFFVKGRPPLGEKRTHHVHIVEPSSKHWQGKILFRDYLIAHPETAQEYEQLKIKLAQQYTYDREMYTEAKTHFINSVLEKVKINGLRIAHALTDREWEAARHFRQKYFFDRVPIADPYTWTFTDPKHVHFILYQGTKIIGYAHIQLWPESRAALRIIVIDEIYRNQGHGGEFLKICERWLLHQGVKKFQIQSSPDAYKFYCDHDYIHMPFNDPDGYEGDPRDIEIGKIL